MIRPDITQATLASSFSNLPGHEEKIAASTDAALDFNDSGHNYDDVILPGEPIVEDDNAETGFPALDQVLKYLRQCIDDGPSTAPKDTGKKRRFAEEWIALGLIRVHMQANPTEAIKCFGQALKILEQIPNGDISKAIALNDVAYCYVKLHNQDRAVRTYWEALRLFKLQNVPDSDIHVAAATRSISLLSSNGRCFPRQRSSNESYKK